VQILSLDGPWQFRELAAGADAQSELNSGDWLPATVPGGVHTDLMAAGRIPDPFYRINEAEVQWVAEKDWLYVRSFDLDGAALAEDRIELVCDGLDTFATVFLNGREIARTSNALTEHTLDVKEHLRAGTNTIGVRFEASERVARELVEKHGEIPGVVRNYMRKPPYTGGWDWGPVLPYCGIWRNIFIRAFSAARIESVYAPVELSEGRGAVLLAVRLARANDEPLTVNATLHHNGRNVAEVEIHDVAGQADAILNVESPLLWWPAGYGDQELYDLRVRLRKGGDELDARDVRIGFRTCELEREPDEAGESFIFKINGRRIFCKGANWIPADSFPWRVTHEKYRRLLEMAVDQNMNMLRIWGGGIYEPDVFYDICDELGILIWMDFIFSCADYPDLDWFHRLVGHEAETVVSRVRNHPSIALYCGNNESHMGHDEWGWPEKFNAETIFHDILPGVCERTDPGGPYWPGSPYGGPSANCETHGDMHNWKVWHGSSDYRTYLASRPRFVSEFGFQAFPTMDTILEFAEPEDLSMDSKVMAGHQRCGGGNEKLRAAFALFTGEPENFERAVLFSQIIQADAMKTGIEHWRRLKWHTAGTLIWQLEDCWPVTSWALIDSALRPKPAYYAVRRAYAPVLITAHIDGGSIVVSGINDTDQAVSGTLDVELFDIRGEAHLLHTDGVSIPADAACVLCTVPVDRIPDLDRASQFVWVTFYSGLYDSSAACFFAEMKDLDLHEPDIMVEVETDEFDSEVLLRLTSPVFVKGVWLSVPGQDVRFDDNAFDLVPYVSHQVTVTLGEGVLSENLRAALKIQHCNRLNPCT